LDIGITNFEHVKILVIAYCLFAVLSQQQKSSAVPSSWFGMCGGNASSSTHLQDSTYLEGDV
jgi:hypothetical protein